MNGMQEEMIFKEEYEVGNCDESVKHSPKCFTISLYGGNVASTQMLLSYERFFMKLHSVQESNMGKFT